MTLIWTDGGLAEGLRCYRAEEFFLAHEHWEAVWLIAKEPEKTFLQGLIQIAAAFHHFQGGNLIGTTLLLRSSLRRLEPYPTFFGGIAVAPLCEEIRVWLRKLESLESMAELTFPQIQLRERIE